MTISGSGQYVVTPDNIRVDEGLVTITGDNGGFNTTIGRSYYPDTSYTMYPIRVGNDGYDPATLTLVGGGDGVNITVEDPGAPLFSANINVGVGDYNNPEISRGTLNVTEGATLISRNNGVYDPEAGIDVGGYNKINIGLRGSGEVNVDGAGSFVAVYGLEGRITVAQTSPVAGVGSEGLLNITNGGTVGTALFQIGRGDGAYGVVNVTGVGSKLVQSNKYGTFGSFNGQDFSDYGPSMTVARDGGYGRLTVSEGGSVNIANVDGLTDSVQLDLGRDYDSTGKVIVRGDGSTLNVTQIGPVDDVQSGNAGLKVGRGGQGILDIYDGGVVNVLGQDAFVSVGRTRDDVATSRSNQINVSDGGILNVDSQAYGNGALNIAQEVGTNGIVTIEGETSEINITSDGDDPSKFGAALSVGRRGDGQLFVQDGADIVIDGGGDRFPIFFVGFGEEDGSVSAKGYAKVTGPGSTITVQGNNEDGETGFISVGRNASSEGYLLIEDGGQVINETNETGSEVAGNAGTTGKLHVTGDGSLFSAGVNLSVGADYDPEVEGDFDVTVGGDATLIASFGGRVEAERIIVGDSGELQIDGGVIAGDVTVTGNTEIATRGEPNGYTTGFGSIEGSLNQTTGSLYLDINDENVVSGGGYSVNHDMLSVSGDATLDGAAIVLNAENLGNSVEDGRLEVGDVFDLISVSGTLTVTNIDQFQLVNIGSEGVEFSLIVGANSLSASVDALPNIAPNAADDAFESSETVTIAGALFLNDDATDQVEFALASVNGSAGNIGTSLTLASGAVVTVQADGTFVYDPNGVFDSLAAGQTGTDSFVYAIADSFGATDEATATVSINGEDPVVDPEPEPEPDPEPVSTDGPDEFAGDGDADQFDGGRGDDTISGGGGGDTLAGGGGKDEISGGGGKDLLQGNGGKDLLQGNGGRDTLEGGGGKDFLNGGGGRDLLDGGGGKDTMEGGGGRDEILGGRGADFLTGGGGRDQFVFDRGNGRDTITDFQQGRDKIVIEGGVEQFADLRIAQFGDDVRIFIANTRVTIEDDLADNFTSADFIF